MASTSCAVMESLLKASLPSRHQGLAPLYIPDDLIFSILARLPAKSIVRFRCVSKSWLAMTSSQTFVDAHLEFSKARPTKLIVPGERLQRQRGRETPWCMEFYKYIGCGGVAELVHGQEIPGEVSARAPPLHCDGLILTFTHDQEIMVCNPATREFLALPKGTNGGVGDDQLVGFGRDPFSKKYKVARFFCQRKLDTSQQECKFEVLTLGTNVWSRTVDPPCTILDLAPDHVVVQGFIYWRPLQQTSFKFFIRFSLADDTFSKVPYPPCEAAPVAFLELESDELSCACVAQPSQVMEIWTCTNTDDMPTWTRRCTFQLPQENVVVPSSGASLGPHGISCYRKNLSFMYGDGYYRCNIGTGVMERIRFIVAFKDMRYYHPEKGRFQEYSTEDVVFRNVNYAESLVQIRGQVAPPKATGCWRKRRSLSWVVALKTAAAELCKITLDLLLLAGVLALYVWMIKSCHPW